MMIWRHRPGVFCLTMSKLIPKIQKKTSPSNRLDGWGSPKPDGNSYNRCQSARSQKRELCYRASRRRRHWECDTVSPLIDPVVNDWFLPEQIADANTLWLTCNSQAVPTGNGYKSVTRDLIFSSAKPPWGRPPWGRPPWVSFTSRQPMRAKRHFAR